MGFYVCGMGFGDIEALWKCMQSLLYLGDSRSLINNVKYLLCITHVGMDVQVVSSNVFEAKEIPGGFGGIDG